MTDVAKTAEGKTAKLVYILYLVGLLLGVTTIVGVIMAYVERGKAPAWVQSHYTFQIRTFWISLLVSIVAIVTMIILIGYLIALAWLIWFILRCVKGMGALDKGEAHPNPTTWTW